MYFYFLIFFCSLPWLIPAVGFLATIDKRGYPIWAGDLLLLLTGFVGLAGFAGQTGLRSWMISRTILAPIVLWIIAAFLPHRQRAETKTQSTGTPHIFIALIWGGWLAWNGYVLTASTGIRGSQEKANIGNLGAIRSALDIYKSDLGTFPDRLEDLVPKYLQVVPQAGVIAVEDRILHPASRSTACLSAIEPNDIGGWAYTNAPRKLDGSVNPDFGKVFINCTHLDVRQYKRLCDY